MPIRLDTVDADFDVRWRAFVAAGRAGSCGVAEVVAAIIADVRERGGEAVAEHTRRLDDLCIDERTLQAEEVDLHRLAASCPGDVVEAIDCAAERIERAHQRQVPSNCWYEEDGIGYGWRWSPISAVGVYVPGGLASYPSSALMTAIPARVAGVERVVLVAPAPRGGLSAALAAACVRAGVSEYYPIGGAQAVAAMAYGAGDLSPVHMIAGPGNAFVTEAKRQVFGAVGIDSLAGPSEVCIVAGAGCDPECVAADLLAQAEHDRCARSVLIAADGQFAEAVAAEIESQLETLATQEIASVSWQNNGAIIVAPLQRASSLVDDLAPEHLHVALPWDAAREFAESVSNAGAIFVGPLSAEVFGDYVTGPSHVLPTSGTARFASGLSTTDFMKRTSVQSMTSDGLDRVAGAAHTLATAEGLAAHAHSVAVRMRTRQE